MISPVSTVSSRRFFSKDYYDRYIHGQTPGGPGRIATAHMSTDGSQSINRKYIPFDEIAKPTQFNRRKQYMAKLDKYGNPRDNDPKLCARLGVVVEK